MFGDCCRRLREKYRASIDKLWPVVTDNGDPDDDPGNMWACEKLLGKLDDKNELPQQHNGADVTKHMLENAFWILYPKKAGHMATAGKVDPDASGKPITPSHDEMMPPRQENFGRDWVPPPVRDVDFVLHDMRGSAQLSGIATLSLGNVLPFRPAFADPNASGYTILTNHFKIDIRPNHSYMSTR